MFITSYLKKKPTIINQLHLQMKWKNVLSNFENWIIYNL
jgi:hypothetical protein